MGKLAEKSFFVGVGGVDGLKITEMLRRGVLSLSGPVKGKKSARNFIKGRKSRRQDKDESNVPLPKIGEVTTVEGRGE